MKDRKSMTWYDRRNQWNKQADDARDAGDVDFARVIHSASFRRLQGKTQILNLGDSDFYRTRLTHSLEVAQIASGLSKQIAKNLSDKHPAQKHLPDRSLIQAIGLTHDLGHPPFGHGGEVALNYCMRDQGGFEGNGQTLRILSKLERYSESDGANLCRRTLLGVLKYPVSFSSVNGLNPKLDKQPSAIRLIDMTSAKPPKCYMDSEQDIVDWILSPLTSNDRKEFQRTISKQGHDKAIHKSFDCSIMDMADDISYGVHDLEDAIAMRLLSRKQFSGTVTKDDAASFIEALRSKYPDDYGNYNDDDVFNAFLDMLFSEGRHRKRAIGRLVHHFITSVLVVEVDELKDPLIRFRAKMEPRRKKFIDALHKVVREQVIFSPEVQHLEFKGQKMVVSVFEAIQAQPDRLLPTNAKKAFNDSDKDLRVICDYVAGMTDAYLLRTYERLFSPRMGSVFDRL